MSLESLPPEILLKISAQVYSIEELLALSSTSRILYHICSYLSPKVISQLTAESGRVFFRPHPHTLIAATARQLADWAVQHDSRRFRLEEAIRGGVDKLLELAIDVVELTLDDIRRLWHFKYNVLNPLDKQLDLSAGPGSDYSWTVCNDPAATLVSWVIYGELFHHSIEIGYLPINSFEHRPLSSLTRYKWLAYCVPDVNCFNYLGFSDEPQFFKQYEAQEEDRFQQLSMKMAYEEFLTDARWETALESNEAFHALDNYARAKFVVCVKHWGFRSLELLVPGGVERLKDDLDAAAANLVVELEEEAVSDDDSEEEEDWDYDIDDDTVPLDPKELERRALFSDPWWLTRFPTLTKDLHFTLWGDWDGGEEGEPALLQAIRSPATLQ